MKYTILLKSCSQAASTSLFHLPRRRTKKWSYVVAKHTKQREEGWKHFFGLGQKFLFLHSVFFLWLSGGCIVYFCVKHGGGLNTYLLSYVASRISLLPVLGRAQIIVYFPVRTQEGIFCGSDLSPSFPYGMVQKLQPSEKPLHFVRT